MRHESRTWFLQACGLWVVSTLVFYLYLGLATENHFPQLEPLLNGTAPRPFVYRAFTPFVIRILSDGLGIPAYLSAVAIIYLSLLGFSLSMSALSTFFLSSQYSWLFGMLAPLGLFPLLLWQRQIYDFPTLFLHTLALYFLARSDLAKYLLTFVLASLSKETSLFLLIFFAVQFWNIGRKRFLLLMALQIAAYVVIRLTLMVVFWTNPGAPVEFHFWDHVNAYLQNPIGTFFLLASLAGLAALFTSRALGQCSFLRNALATIGGPSLLLYLFFGMPFEVRVFLEAYPSIFLAASFVAISTLSRRPDVSKAPA